MIDSLRRAIRELHGSDAIWLESVPMRETFGGSTVWEGVVEVFSLQGHPAASRCYAWSHSIDTSQERRFVAVLQQGPVDSPIAAVRAAIVQEHRES